MTMIETASNQLESGTQQSGLYGAYMLEDELCGRKDGQPPSRRSEGQPERPGAFSATRRRRLRIQAPFRRTKLSMYFFQRAAKLGREERVAMTE